MTSFLLLGRRCSALSCCCSPAQPGRPGQREPAPSRAGTTPHWPASIVLQHLLEAGTQLVPQRLGHVEVDVVQGDVIEGGLQLNREDAVAVCRNVDFGGCPLVTAEIYDVLVYGYLVLAHFSLSSSSAR